MTMLATMLARGESWLTRARCVGLSRLMVVVQAGCLGFIVAGSHGLIVGKVGPSTVDFASFYAAGSLANAGTPDLAYDHAAHLAAEEKATEKGIGYEYFFYPPTFLLICAPLARLPYILSFYVFEAATLAAWLWLAWRIAGPGATAPLLACSSVWWTLGLGQNALLSGALMAAGTLALKRRPILAGIAFASLCYKPHLGLLVPVALLAGRQYRAFASAALMLAACLGASLLAFGIGTWRRFLENELTAPGTLYGGQVALAAHIDVRGGAMLLGLHGMLPVALQIMATLASLTAVIIVWRRDDTYMRVASLAAGTLAVIPFALFYDLIIATIAGAWLVRAGMRTGFLPGERLGLALCLLADLAAYPLGLTLHVPLGMLIAPALLLLCVRRAGARL